MNGDTKDTKPAGPLPHGLSMKHIAGLMEQSYEEGRDEKDKAISIQLLELPEQIMKQSLKLAVFTEKVEDLKLFLERAENEALELVLCATENGKPKYTNDKTRKIAQEQILRDNKFYQDSVDDLKAHASTLRQEQIQLDYLHNRFKAYLAIAGMHGVE